MIPRCVTATHVQSSVCRSKSQRFDGHKMALELVEESEENAQVEETIADCAYGHGLTRREFADAGRKLVALVPKRPNQRHFPKEDFVIDLEARTCQCPVGQVTGRLVRRSRRKDRRGQVTDRYAFQFDGAVCASCPLRTSCVKGKSARGEVCPCTRRKLCFRRPERFSAVRPTRPIGHSGRSQNIALHV